MSGEWTKSFAYLPHKTITGQRIWLATVYAKVTEPEYPVDALFSYGPTTTYATILEILAKPTIDNPPKTVL